MAIAENALSASPDDRRPLGGLERACPVRSALAVLNGRWRPLILLHLHMAPRKYR
jgi:DNA-binding HxlR family transcriptional regulator